MSFLNQVVLIGNLGKDPEVLKTTETGCFVRMQLATNKKYANAKGEKIEDTQWHTVNLNNAVGKFVSEYFKKGDKALVIGELRSQTWTDKKGIEHISTYVFARECKSLVPKSKDKTSSQKSSNVKSVYETEMERIQDIFSDEIPQIESPLAA